MDKIFETIEYLQSNNIEYKENLDLKTITWIKRGGIARIWVQPNCLPDFEKLISWCQQGSLQFEVIGNTSNSYFLNDYHPQMVISTLKLTSMLVTGDTIVCDCGYNMARLARHCITEGIAGYEGFIGLPGTVAGAAINNAGCYGSLISDVVVSVTIIQNGKKVELSHQELKYSPRNSALKSKRIEGVVTNVIFDISRKEDMVCLRRRAEEHQQHRKKYQEHTHPNLGTTFCLLEFKKPSLVKKIISALITRIIHYFVPSLLYQQRLKVGLFWLLNNNGNIRNYVSKHSVQCFVWKDEHADMVFLDYVDFIKRKTTNAVMEIDIKG